jgi:23S rRNA-/tRNA-specific pseudouridylate synthase
VADVLYGDGQPLLLSQLKRNYRATGDAAERPLMGRVALHAYTLSIKHPTTEEDLTITAPYPKDFAASLKQLK